MVGRVVIASGKNQDAGFLIRVGQVGPDQATANQGPFRIVDPPGIDQRLWTIIREVLAHAARPTSTRCPRKRLVLPLRGAARPPASRATPGPGRRSRHTAAEPERACGYRNAP